LHLVGILFPHINDDARSKSHQISFLYSAYVTLQAINSVAIKRLLRLASFIPAFGPANCMFTNNFFFWHNSPTRSQTASLLRFLDHTQTHARPLGLLWTSDQPVTEAATYTAHNKQKRRISLSSAGFESSILASEQPQNYALDRTATAIGHK